MPSIIVSLSKSSTAAQVDAAAKKAEEKGWTVTNKYTSTIKGFSATKDVAEGTVATQDVEALKTVDGVEDIEFDSTVTTQ
ncbi:hypothetical protein M406DRAFT_355691 [Cryphonectria parasitica EP155]|uniref:Inhibitor I9 domain-containing protein n=1 Tax=Cryphonectria parasitica (strain ATCC 38755 / EP155) TaxID=660469 RepID=A0A9P4Y6Q8_CRYP1|nr:uncharacterized protein M406DRAFT_355691 [Cryphonectria parasitica EP155]KAF3767743.1 hypothetical protein M406DRAFT_355691 [Cryphonectria parasitica EP155]